MLIIISFVVAILFTLIQSAPTGTAIGDISPVAPYGDSGNQFAISQTFYQDPARYVTSISEAAIPYFFGKYSKTSGHVELPSSNEYCQVFTCPTYTANAYGFVSPIAGKPTQVSPTINCLAEQCSINGGSGDTTIVSNWLNPDNLPVTFDHVDFNGAYPGLHTWSDSITVVVPNNGFTCEQSNYTGLMCVLWYPTFISADFTCTVQGFYFNPTENGDQYQTFSSFSCPPSPFGTIQAPINYAGMYRCGLGSQCTPP